MRMLKSLFLAVLLPVAALQTNLSAALPVRVMPVGDSITDGYGAPGGYRAPLYRLMTNAGYNLDFVGTAADNGAAGLPDPDHEGHSGWRIDQIDSTIESVFDKVSDPDIILLLIGTNDYGQGYDTPHAIDRLENLIARMATNRPYCKIIVANLLVRGEPYNTQIQTTFNPYIPALVQRQRALGREVYFDDLRSAVPLADFPDQLHPGALGYAKMATNWLAAINNVFTPEGSKSPPAISRAYGWAGLTNATVVFSKPIADESAIPANFTVGDGLSVTRAVLDPATKREVTLTTSPQQPSTSYAITVNGVQDRTALRLKNVSNETILFKSMAARGVGANVPEARSYKLVYSLDIPNKPNYTSNPIYTADHRSEISGFTRIAYYLELQQPGGPLSFMWVSMDAFTADVSRIGVPTSSSGAFFQQPVTNMNVQSSVPGIITGTNLSGGNIEFWPSNSSPSNNEGVPNASNAAFDWGDSPSPGNYGSMQVHNHDARQVIFAFNRWGGAGGFADLGIGNRSGNYLDWIFAQNAGSYTLKTLQVYVMPTPIPSSIDARFTGPAQFKIQWVAQPGASYSVYKKLSLDGSAWNRIGGAFTISNTAAFTDSESTGSAGYYRIASP
jgi:lysophospholipase L1-like esterase